MNIIRYILALTFLFLPLQFALSPFDGVDLAIVRVIILCLFFCVIAVSLFKKSLYVPTGWHVVFFVFLSMYIAFSLFYSPEQLWTLRKILFLLSFFPLYYILITLFIARTNTHLLLCRSIVYGAMLAGIIGILQFTMQFIVALPTLLTFWSLFTPFFLGGTFSSSVSAYNSWLVHVGSHDIMRAVGFFPDPHIFSFYLGLIIPIALGLYVTSRHKKWLMIFFVLVIADLFTFSRGGYIALLGGIFFSIIFLWHSLHTTFKHVFTAILFCFILFFMVPHNPFTQRFFSSFETTDTSSTHRIVLWKQACAEIAKRPFFGVGLGAYPSIVDPTATYRTPIYAHDLFLDIAVEIGLIGLFLFLCLITYTIIIFYRNRKQPLAFSAIISLIIFFTHALFDTPLFSVHVLPIFIFILSLAAYYEITNNRSI
jgi:O-antigen ligase